MTIPAATTELKKRIQGQVEDFFSRHQPEECQLILDSTGPSLTKHYLVLSAIGQERLLRFKAVHAYSGGVWAYFGFLALSNNKANLRYEEFGEKNVESAMRRFHHSTTFSPLGVLAKLMTGHSAFGSAQPLRDMLRFYFDEQYLQQPLTAFSDHLHIYLGHQGRRMPFSLSAASLRDTPELQPFSGVAVAELISLATKVPFVYGQPDRKDVWFDAAYTQGYLESLKTASKKGDPTLISTPWKSGQKGDITFVNCFSSENPKLSMAADFAKLILNIPNRTFGHDIAGAFL